MLVRMRRHAVVELVGTRSMNKRRSMSKVRRWRGVRSAQRVR